MFQFDSLFRTTGGVGGSTVRVSTLADLTSAVADDTPKIVIISGTITGDTVVKIGANKSVLGAAGACKSSSEIIAFHLSSN